MARGGYRPGGGRPKKADEDKLIERLSKMDEVAFKVLEERVTEGNEKCLQLWFNYRFGKPREKVDITTNGENITGFNYIVPDGPKHNTQPEATPGVGETEG